MNQILKQVAGIDVAQNELVIQLGRISTDLSPELYASSTFPNTAKGFTNLLQWVNKLTAPQLPVSYVMEATGVYHEAFAYYLDAQALNVSIVLPNKISNYHRTLKTKTVTDKTASQTIAQFGLQRKMDQWHRPTPLFKQLRQLTRERSQLIDEQTVLKNQLHAEKAEAEPNLKSIERINARIALIRAQEKQIMEELKALAVADPKIKQSIGLLCSIPGVGLLTALTVLAETNGFELIRNKRQLTSYAGLDIQEKQSGTSVRGKTRISKKGNKMLRRALYLPALAAIKHDPRAKAIFARLGARHGFDMKAAVAVQRKLLELIYTIYKKQTPYDKNYLQPQTHEANIYQE